MSAPRFTPGASVRAASATPYWGEHVARYRFAASHVRGRVLDVACGTGFGLPWLASAAGCVVGVDRDEETARTAARAAAGHRASVLSADAGALPFADARFDAVTSFETIEHLTDRSRFLAELGRVLTPDGICLVSTPNANYTQPLNGVPRNPYHVHEYAPAEFAGELSRLFASVTILGQTLDPRYTIPPFWDAQQRLPRTFGVQVRLLAWRVLNKLPVAMRERTSHAMWRRPFYPTETDYHFDEATAEFAPVLVAVCRP